MSDLEFDVLDDLDIKPILIKIYNKGWLKCFSEPEVELDASSIDLEVHFRNYSYLASKEGLKAHNKN